jgi:hypothetical protein
LTVFLKGLEFAALRFLIEQINGGHHVSGVVEKEINAKHASFQLLPVQTVSFKTVETRV